MIHLATTLALAVLPVAQQDPPPPPATELLQRYRRLDRDQRNTVVRNMERRLLRVRDRVLRRPANYERGIRSYPVISRSDFYKAAKYAPVATPRQLVTRGSTRHRKATAGMEPFLFLSDLNACVTYDWRQRKAAKIRESLDDDQRFANYVNGYPPGSDHAIAAILAELDDDPAQHQLAFYFEHLYTDRYGAAYEGVSMFDAWNSGAVVEMPDTDAIAFARDILNTRSFKSPIPGDRRRTRLYRKVKEAFQAHREYRSLRLAAAASFLVARPVIDPTYEPLIRRCRWLWIQCGYDPGAFKKRLQDAGDRATLLAEVDRAIESSREVVDGERDALQARADFLRSLAAKELETLGQ
ncbi:MAG: hypothetical protein NXI31_11675 [bacterium]|nr:hypothetical protein [bacterium]